MWDEEQRVRATEDVAEDFLRLSMGVVPDFPYYGELLDKETLGLERSDADDVHPSKKPGRGNRPCARFFPEAQTLPCASKVLNGLCTGIDA